MYRCLFIFATAAQHCLGLNEFLPAAAPNAPQEQEQVEAPARCSYVPNDDTPAMAKDGTAAPRNVA